MLDELTRVRREEVLLQAFDVAQPRSLRCTLHAYQRQGVGFMRWRELPEARKATYNQKAKEDKARYDAALKAAGVLTKAEKKAQGAWGSAPKSVRTGEGETYGKASTKPKGKGKGKKKKPDCRYGVDCWTKSCPFIHPAGRKVKGCQPTKAPAAQAAAKAPKATTAPTVSKQDAAATAAPAKQTQPEQPAEPIELTVIEGGWGSDTDDEESFPEKQPTADEPAGKHAVPDDWEAELGRDQPKQLEFQG